MARGYIAVGISTAQHRHRHAAEQFSANRAFVQWAGFTAGLSVSFYDFYPAAALLVSRRQPAAEDTGDGGWWVWGYTAQFGGGFSATLSAEERRVTQIIGFSGAGLRALGGHQRRAGTTGQSGGSTLLAAPAGPRAATAAGRSPDIVANLRVDQAWGSAQVMGALHEVNPAYYGATSRLPAIPPIVGLGRRRRPQDQRAVHRAWRLLRQPRSTTPKAPSSTFRTPRQRARERAMGRPKAYGVESAIASTAARLLPATHRLPADDGLGLRRRLRALLDAAMAPVVGR